MSSLTGSDLSFRRCTGLGLIWDLASFFNTSGVDYENDEWLKITSVLYYLDNILYSVVRIKDPDKEVWISLIPSRNSRIKVMLDQ